MDSGNILFSKPPRSGFEVSKLCTWGGGNHQDDLRHDTPVDLTPDKDVEKNLRDALLALHQVIDSSPILPATESDLIFGDDLAFETGGFERYRRRESLFSPLQCIGGTILKILDAVLKDNDHAYIMREARKIDVSGLEALRRQDIVDFSIKIAEMLRDCTESAGDASRASHKVEIVTQTSNLIIHLQLNPLLRGQIFSLIADVLQSGFQLSS
ncbi:hypothetical protein GGX14DRAFT_385734 [Mycena pura]|uniref:Uncharacterized protein n=1 Tax=Mycena pura TaxID=153505 RepID=A0AAD6YQZ1_9AGAR|nr:hypothetical protein GGX14DRAFT_385734 [Mycena pura]